MLPDVDKPAKNATTYDGGTCFKLIPETHAREKNRVYFSRRSSICKSRTCARQRSLRPADKNPSKLYKRTAIGLRMIGRNVSVLLRTRNLVGASFSASKLHSSYRQCLHCNPLRYASIQLYAELIRAFVLNLFSSVCIFFSLF